MSIEALNWALGHIQSPDMPTSTRFVLMILANRSDPEGMCWPSIRYIRDRTGLSDSTIRTASKELEDKNLMRVEQQRRVDGGKTSNRYLLRLDTPPPSTIGGAPPQPLGEDPQPLRDPPPTIGGHETKEETSTRDRPLKAGTDRGALCKALIEKGVKITPMNPLVVDWLARGLTIEMALEGVARARLSKPDEPIPAAYLAPIIADILSPKAPVVRDIRIPSKTIGGIEILERMKGPR